jgi:hypothetical protein
MPFSKFQGNLIISSIISETLNKYLETQENNKINFIYHIISKITIIKD